VDWVARSSIAEQDRPDAIPLALKHSPYCVHVDKAALKSVVEAASKPPEDDVDSIDYVSLIQADWTLPNPDEHDPGENGTDDPYDDGEEPIKGCRLYDVGWTRVCNSGLVLPTYARLTAGDWEVSYTRPPEVAVH